ncbi:putative SANT/Myb domain, Homeobox-like domain superfamily protein [Plasmopara halstedii]
MQALELYGSRKSGDEWRHITAFVGSRTIEEVRTHGRQYLMRLIQQSPASAETSRNTLSAGGHNNVSRQNYQLIKSFDPRGGKRSVPSTTGNSRTLNAAAFECAQSMRSPFSPQYHNRALHYPQHQKELTTLRRQSKPWTFHEDKAFETALARWAGGRSYPWARIAAAIPGKTVSDVYSRYEEMVGEVASIESETLPVSTTTRSMSTLSQRAIPPPPIEVPPRRGGTDTAMGIFPPSRRSRGRRGSASGFTMLSPTFLDFLAKEAESEEKSSLPILPLPFPGHSSLPSPLFSPTLLPSMSSAILSSSEANLATGGQQSNKMLTSGNDDSKVDDIGDTTSTNTTGNSDEPQNSRVLNEFLANDFRFDDPIGSINHNSKKASTANFTDRNDVAKQDIEMADASAA